jgi:hypothetical protein
VSIEVSRLAPVRGPAEIVLNVGAAVRTDVDQLIQECAADDAVTVLDGGCRGNESRAGKWCAGAGH